MSLVFVKDALSIFVNDSVTTPYGDGVVEAIYQYEFMGSTLDSKGYTTVAIHVKLSFGKLFSSEKYGYAPIRKNLSQEEYASTIHDLDEFRKLKLQAKCLEMSVQYNDDRCVRCMFESSDAERKKSRSKRRRKIRPCDVCANNVCQDHVNKSFLDEQQFNLCLDCNDDFNQELKVDGNNEEELISQLERLYFKYDHMWVHLSFCLPKLSGLAARLQKHETNQSRLKLGTSAAGILSSSLALAAGAATLLTPAGPALIAACVLTTTTNVMVQVGNATRSHYSMKDVNQLTARVLTWHGLALSILVRLEGLLNQLMKDPLLKTAKFVKSLGGPSNQKSLQCSNSTVTHFTATHSAATGLRVTSAVSGSAAAASAGTSVLTMAPFLGAAVAVSLLAYDAANVQSTLGSLRKQSARAMALRAIQKSLYHVPMSIDANVKMLLEGLNELKRAKVLVAKQTKRKEQQAQKNAIVVESNVSHCASAVEERGDSLVPDGEASDITSVENAPLVDESLSPTNNLRGWAIYRKKASTKLSETGETESSSLKPQTSEQVEATKAASGSSSLNNANAQCVPLGTKARLSWRAWAFSRSQTLQQEGALHNPNLDAKSPACEA